MDWCEERGLRAYYGKGARSGSYFAMLDHQDEWYAPFALWTYGQVETQFQYLKARPEFSDEAVRREWIERLNRIPGVDLPLDGIERRPSFPISVLTNEDALAQFFSTTAWALGLVDR